MLRSIVSVVLVAVTIGVGVAPKAGAATTLTADEQEYVGKLEVTLGLQYASMTRFSDILGDFAVSDLLDPGWVARAAAEPALWQALYDYFSGKVRPPRSFADVHNEVLELLRLTAAAGADYTDGLVNTDADAINRGVEGIRRATDQIQNVNRALADAGLSLDF